VIDGSVLKNSTFLFREEVVDLDAERRVDDDRGRQIRLERDGQRPGSERPIQS